MATSPSSVAGELEELKVQIERMQAHHQGEIAALRAQLETLAAQIQQDKALARGSGDEPISEIEQEVDDNQEGYVVFDQADQGGTGLSTNATVEHENADSVDLTQNEYGSVSGTDDDHVLSNPWWRNFELHGFGAAGLYDTGRNGTRPHGGFEIKEASLFVHADVWKKVELFLELQTNRLGKDDQLFTRTGEVYIQFHDVLASDSSQMGVKVGRFDIPFGEEYLWQDAIDNPLITNSASYVYGWDEGVLVYGEYKGASLIAAITDGTDTRSREDHDDKAINLKLSGNPTERLYLSLSAMRNGSAGKSAVEFGGSHFRPVGASHFSTLGSSSSEEVIGTLYQVDAKHKFSERSYVSVFMGYAHQEDDDSTFDRDFRWFGVEPYIQLSDRWYAVARYSEIGTYDSDEGYHFDGKTFANGNGSFGYDTRRFRRFGIGVGYEPNPRVRFKLELGRDWFDLIDASSLSGRDDREFAAAEVAVGF